MDERYEFRNNDPWQREKRDKILIPQFYEKYFPGNYVLVGWDSPVERSLQRAGIDTIVRSKKGVCFFVDDKIMRWPKNGIKLTAFYAETKQCTVPGRESAGWVRYSKSDLILYCFAMQDGSLEAYLIPFISFRLWFEKREEDFRLHEMDNEMKTIGRLVPIERVTAELPGVKFYKFR